MQIKSDIKKLKNVPTKLSNLKSEIGKLNVDKLEPFTEAKH